MLKILNKPNRLTLASIGILGVNSLVGSIYLIILIATQDNREVSQWLYLGLLFVLVALNTIFLFKVAKGKPLYLKISVWIYLIQIISIESDSWHVGVQFGLNVTFLLDIGEQTMIINSLPALFALILYQAYRGELANSSFDKIEKRTDD